MFYRWVLEFFMVKSIFLITLSSVSTRNTRVLLISFILICLVIRHPFTWIRREKVRKISST